MIAAIIQARLNSYRLPGKAMQMINGQPILGHVIDRTRKALKNIIVATPDKEIYDYALSKDVQAFIGSEKDVLDRYYQAAKQFNVRHIVRITSDNPLIDPDVINKVVDYYLNHKFIYVSNTLKRTYPKGLDVEVCSMNALFTAWVHAVNDYDHEHVTPYLYQNSLIFQVGNVEHETDLSHLRWTVDYPEDLEFARWVYSRLGNRDFRMQDIISLCELEHRFNDTGKVKQEV